MSTDTIELANPREDLERNPTLYDGSLRPECVDKVFADPDSLDEVLQGPYDNQVPQRPYSNPTPGVSRVLKFEQHRPR